MQSYIQVNGITNFGWAERLKYLGVDIGTGGSRAVVIDDGGKIVAQATEPHAPFDSPMPGWSEQNPEDWWRASSAAIKTVLTTVPADEIAAISFSGQMHGSVFLDENDQVIRPALLWNDQRTERQVEWLGQNIGDERIIELTGNRAVTGFTLPKLLWLRETEPENWARVKTVLLPKDYIRLRLTGDKASDVADSSGTLMFDVRNRCWSEEMLAAVEMNASVLPKVFESTEITGVVSLVGSDATGLRAGTSVVAGAGDNAAGAIGAGLVVPGSTGVTIGTSGVVFIVSDEPRFDPKGRTHSLCHAIPGRWHMTGVTLAAGYSLKWLRETIAPERTYDELTAEAAKIAAGSEGLIWLPYLMGERSPHMDANARAGFIGLTASHTRGHLVRAVMEGVAFSLKESIDIFSGLGAPIDEIRLGGGGATSPLWRQIQADVYGQAVSVIDGDEGAALGAAILAGVGVGAWDSGDSACADVIKIRETIEPDAEATAILEENYERYRSLYPALKSVM